MAKVHAPPTPAEQLNEQTVEGDELEEADLAALRAAIERGEEQYQRGEYEPAEVLLEDVRKILGAE